MNLYPDDDMVKASLVARLRKAGHLHPPAKPCASPA
jgi:hypothetical protein